MIADAVQLDAFSSKFGASLRERETSSVAAEVLGRISYERAPSTTDVE